MNKSSLINAATLTLVSLAAISCSNDKSPITVRYSNNINIVITECKNSRETVTSAFAFECDNGATYKSNSVLQYSTGERVMFFP